MTNFYHHATAFTEAAPPLILVTVTNDGYDYRYAILPSERAAFKKWAVRVFANCKRLRGRFPNYHVEQPQ